MINFASAGCVERQQASPEKQLQDHRESISSDNLTEFASPIVLVESLLGTAGRAHIIVGAAGYVGTLGENPASHRLLEASGLVPSRVGRSSSRLRKRG